MASPQNLALAKPLIDAMVSLLKSDLGAVITEINAGYADGIDVPPITDVRNYVPTPTGVQQSGGQPIIGIQELPSEFSDDTQFSMNATHHYLVVVILQNSDHGTLVELLRRAVEAIANTVQNDREQGTGGGSGGIMRTEGGAYSVNFIATYPGPMLGNVDPGAPDAAPTSFMSLTGIHFSSQRREI